MSVEEFRKVMWESKLAVRVSLDNALNASKEEVVAPLYLYVYR